jgi:hypothetical protein
VIDDVGDLYTLGAELVALLGQRSQRTSLESKMIEASGDTEPAIDAGIVFWRHVWNSLRFQKGDELIVPDIEKEVSKVPTFCNLDRVHDYWLEPQNALVELTGLVEVKRREADM